MSYELDLHRHVKIWLSTNPQRFLNPENQLRLVEMRALNPADVIHLLYSKQLLSDDALRELYNFCSTHNIIAVSIEDDILPNCTENEDERNLADLCRQEIQAIKDNTGGNPASVSDMLRWLSRVYKLGVYSDLDVRVKTQELPQIITVNAPVLLKIGSIKIPIAGLSQDNLECIALNNDTVAVVGNDELTKDIISRIQRRIYDIYQKPTHFTANYEQLVEDTINHVAGLSNIETAAHVATLVLQQQPHYPVTQHLTALGEMGLNLFALRKTILEKKIPEAQELSTAFTENLEQNKRLFLQKIDDPTTPAMVRKRYRQLLAMNDESLAKALENSYYHLLLQLSVTHSTGPASLILSLFNHVYLTEDKIQEQVKPFSFQHYCLNSAFYSPNGLDFHFSSEDSRNRLAGEIRANGDQSRLKPGELAVIERELKMEQAARAIQCAYRKHLGHKIAAAERLAMPKVSHQSFFSEARSSDEAASILPAAIPGSLQ
ncbi:MAG: glycosyltransferase family 88 protein [Legionella sp.]|nr:glycosyltransferase family 88 protein [Legionella sp.]